MQDDQASAHDQDSLGSREGELEIINDEQEAATINPSSLEAGASFDFAGAKAFAADIDPNSLEQHEETDADVSTDAPVIDPKGLERQDETPDDKHQDDGLGKPLDDNEASTIPDEGNFEKHENSEEDEQPTKNAPTAADAAKSTGDLVVHHEDDELPAKDNHQDEPDNDASKEEEKPDSTEKTGDEEAPQSEEPDSSELASQIDGKFSAQEVQEIAGQSVKYVPPEEPEDTEESSQEETEAQDDEIQEKQDATEESSGSEAVPALLLAATDFGRGNQGRIGNKLEDEQKQALIHDVGDGNYWKKPSRRWICVDGRLPRHMRKLAEGEADPQTAGGIVLTNVAIDLMLTDMHPEPVSSAAARHTRDAFRDELKPVIHGDARGQKAGCGANQHFRDALRINADNEGSVARLAWQCCQWLKIDEWVTERSLTQAIQTGKLNADNEDVWDAEPEHVTSIIMNEGADYEELMGDHKENIAVMDFGGHAFDKAEFNKDHDHDFNGHAVSAFGASMGELKDTMFQRIKQHGGSDHDAAMRVACAVLFNIGVCKAITNDYVPLAAISTQTSEK
jgi:hypothetical protein